MAAAPPGVELSSSGRPREAPENPGLGIRSTRAGGASPSGSPTRKGKVMEPVVVNVVVPLTPEALVAQLRAYREQIPEYTQLTPVSSKILRAAAAANIHFIHASINAVGTSPSVQNALSTNEGTLWQEASDSARWTAVEDELRALLKGVAAANLTRRH